MVNYSDHSSRYGRAGESMLLQDTTPWEGLNLHYIYNAASVQVFWRVREEQA